MRMRSVAAMTVALLAVTACSGDPEAPGTSAAPASTSATPTPTPTPAVTVRGADATLTAAVAKVYRGKTGIEAKASIGTWGREKVAVVTSGKDVTLAVGPKWKVVGGWWPSLGSSAPTFPSKPRFVLVIGSDSRGSSLAGSRGDSLQILGVDGKGGGGIVGIPRDLWVPIASGGTAKINAAFSTGGGKNQTATVRAVTGLPVEGYVVTGFAGFRKIVDEAGGLPITLQESFTFLGKLKVKAGKQVADGGTTLAYARERKALADGDFGRSRHQQEILLAAALAARIKGPEGLARQMTITSKYSETDLSAQEALTFLAAFYRLNPTKVGHTVVDGAIGTSGDGQSIVKVTPATTATFRKFRDGRL